MNKTKKIENAMTNKRALNDPECKNKYAILSDLHLGAGNNNDNALKNANYTFEALKYYNDNDYYVILNGDTFELAENKSIEPIKCAHENIMWILSEIHKKGKLIIIRGNHDAELTPKLLATRQSSYTKKVETFLEDATIYDSAIIDSEQMYVIMHGHQVIWRYQPFFNKIMNFVIRHVWAPLETYILRDPTSETDGFEDNTEVDKPFSDYGVANNCIMICGHTHSVQLLKDHYFNIGGGTMPRCITAGEIVDGQYRPCKWSTVVEHQVVLIKRTYLY